MYETRKLASTCHDRKTRNSHKVCTFCATHVLPCNAAYCLAVCSVHVPFVKDQLSICGVCKDVYEFIIHQMYKRTCVFTLLRRIATQIHLPQGQPITLLEANKGGAYRFIQTVASNFSLFLPRHLEHQNMGYLAKLDISKFLRSRSVPRKLGKN